MDPRDPFDKLKDRIVSIEGPLGAGELDAVERVQILSDRSAFLRSAIDQWVKQQDSERGLRSKYAMAILIVFCAQLAFANIVLILLGAGCIALSDWVANVFFVSTFAEVAAGTAVIIRYLFPERLGQLLAAVQRMTGRSDLPESRTDEPP